MESKLFTDQALGKTDPMEAGGPSKSGTISLPMQVFLLVIRSLTTLLRTPEALLPPIAISIFFLVIYQSTLGKAASFIPGIGGSYLGFILPLSIVSGSLSGSGIAAQNLVRDIERGYFDKLLLTPVRRAALLLAPILAGAVILGLQAAIVVSVGLLLGLKPVTGLPGLLAVIGLGVLLGIGFAGFTVSAALGSGSAAATQGASFLFFPLTFLAPTFVPLSLLSGWLEVAAKVNPITYVLEAMRSLLNTGWDAKAIGTSILACLILAAAMYALAAFALSVRVRRS
jgi:ABC transporter DrrB family efflux protein